MKNCKNHRRICAGVIFAWQHISQGFTRQMGYTVIREWEMGQSDAAEGSADMATVRL
jgi:hypothetical protein